MRVTNEPAIFCGKKNGLVAENWILLLFLFVYCNFFSLFPIIVLLLILILNFLCIIPASSLLVPSFSCQLSPLQQSLNAC
jgi:hypothetical protein